MRKNLSIKQKIFVDEYIKTKGNGTKSAQRAYDVKNEEVATSIATENLTKPLIKVAIEDRMDELGITDNYLLTKHKELLEITGEDEVQAKSKGLDMAYKLKGHYKDRLSGQSSTVYNTQINLLDPELRRAKIKELEQKLIPNNE